MNWHRHVRGEFRKRDPEGRELDGSVGDGRVRAQDENGEICSDGRMEGDKGHKLVAK